MAPDFEPSKTEPSAIESLDWGERTDPYHGSAGARNQQYALG
jgi:hypothetical protein